MKAIGYATDTGALCPSCAPRPPLRGKALTSGDEFHEPGFGRFTLTCDSCERVLSTCDHGPESELECDCDTCLADQQEPTS